MVNITELGLSANMPVAEANSKMSWKADGNDTFDDLPKVHDFGYEGIALEPQRIRTFEFNYTFPEMKRQFM
jgi:hypothetical protein